MATQLFQTDSIVCPACQAEILLSEAVTAQLHESIREELTEELIGQRKALVSTDRSITVASFLEIL